MTFIKLLDPALKVKVVNQEFVGGQTYEVSNELAKQMIESNLAVEVDKPEPIEAK